MGNTSSWITVTGVDDAALGSLLEARVQEKIKDKKFSWDNLKYIEKVHFFPVPEGISVSPERLERLRHLCQLWDVKLKPREITSHRKFIGPVIIAVKKLFFPIFHAFLKDTLHQQRSFNAAAIALLAELSEEIEKIKTGQNGD